MLTRIAVILLALMSTAFAQQPKPSPIDQALGIKVMEEVNANIQLRAQLIAAQERIKELEQAKPETKKEDEKIQIRPGPKLKAPNP